MRTISKFGWLLVAAAAANAARGTPALAASAYRYTAAVVAEYRVTDGVGLLMPTGVTVAPDATVVVVDGANDRLVQFAPDGEHRGEIRQVGEATLHNPLSAHFDPGGRLWIVDTGHNRVLLRAADGTLARTLDLRATGLEPPPEPADCALAPDGGALWITDNNHHRLLRHELESGRTQAFGRRGESLGQLHYPFALATTAVGDVVVADVINGRAQVFSSAGAPAGRIGAYGVELGELYRPKGLALDAAGNVWVADSTLNVVQVFTLDGRLIDVLRDDSGAPYRFEHPVSLAFDSGGDLYVVELLAGAARRLRVATNPDAPPAAPSRRASGGAAPQARACTLCHLEWMSPLVDGRPTTLLGLPPNPPELPHVSRAEVCLGCHDGGVGDSRRRVWVEHGHRTGVLPPPGVAVPADLPLADGRIACRTCHSAHMSPERRANIEEIVFLRVKSTPAELCGRCHVDYAGETAGSHPTGDLRAELEGPATREAEPSTSRPSSLHGSPGPGASSIVSCLSCHAGHGARHDALLVLNPDDNTLCLTCHAELKPELFSEATRSAHGRLPALDAGQRAVAAGFETRTGPDGALLCLTCHQAHDAALARNLLAFDPAGQEVCAACHPAQRGLIGSSHDLRTNHPDAANLLGATVTSGGACSACHTAHRYARAPEPGPLDPAGKCLACHAAGRLAADAALPAVNHPEAACGACHDPHAAAQPNYLAARPVELCAACHEGYARLAGGPHDVTHAAAEWPSAAVESGDPCLACHRTHGTEATGLMRVAPATGTLPGDSTCVACHPLTAMEAGSPIALQHPRDATRMRAPAALPLERTGGQELVVCRTCHDAHAAGTGSPLLRVAPGAPDQELCVACHRETEHIDAIGHGAAELDRVGFVSSGCRPCHRVHADPRSLEARYLWPLDLAPPAGLDMPTVADRHCIACHRPDGPTSPPAVANHPPAQMFNPTPPDAPGFLPLFNPQGQVDPAGTISCRTCHLSHGRQEPALVRTTVGATQRELRARQWHVRSFTGDNVCTTCHGVDALRRFLYFHDPARRGGPIESPPGLPVPQPAAPPRPPT